MSDDDDALSTARLCSDASEPEPLMITCRFTNGLTGDTYFTKPLEVDNTMSVGFIFHTVKSELGYSAFKLKVGKQIWQSDGLDLYERFWESAAVNDHFDSDACEVVVEVIKLTMQED